MALEKLSSKLGRMPGHFVTTVCVCTPSVA